MLKWRWIVGIVITVAFAVGLRLWGIEWGLPNALHAFSYHTDETVILLHSTNRIGSGGLNVFAGQFLPHFYNYGSLQLYLINISVSIVSAYMPAAHASGDFSRQLFSDYLTGRILTAIMGAVSVWALWALGRRLYGEAAGLLGAFLLAVTPLHAQHSHFMTVDVPATMWVVLALLWCAKAQTDERRLRALVIAGAFAGFAAATKYNCAIAAMPVVYSCCNTAHPNLALSAKTKTTQIIAATSALILAYLAACPGTLLESSLFLHDFLFEARHVSSQQELWFMGTGVGWWYIISRNLVDGLGLPLLWAAIGGAIYAVRKRSFGDILILLFVLPYYIVVGAAVSRYARYEIPLLPFLALWAARLLTDRSLYTLKTQKWIVGTATVAVTLATTASAIALLMPMSQPDPRDRAAEWISTNIPAAAQIGMPDDPWFWSIPIDRFFCLPGPVQWKSAPAANLSAARIVPNYLQTNAPSPFESTALITDKPLVVVMSEFEYYDRLRLKDPATLAYLANLRQNYSAPIVFKDTHWLGGQKSIAGLPCQDLPIDMLYTSPTVLVFKRD